MNAIELSQNEPDFNIENGTPPMVYRPARVARGHEIDHPISLEEAEKGISVHVGDEFTLQLGDRGWKMRIEDETRLQLVTEVDIVNAGEWTFVAQDCGKTSLFVSSDATTGGEMSGRALTLFVEIRVTILP